MSVLIKGLEMPKNCYECKFALLDYTTLFRAKRIRNQYACVLTHKAITSTKRNRFCPLIEIPPHGRLIDADALRYMFEPWPGEKENGINIDKCVVPMAVIRANIDDAPTIIEAEEGE